MPLCKVWSRCVAWFKGLRDRQMLTRTRRRTNNSSIMYKMCSRCSDYADSSWLQLWIFMLSAITTSTLLQTINARPTHGGDHGVSVSRHLKFWPRGCTIMVRYPRFNQINIEINSNSRRTFAYLRIMSIQNCSCDTNKWLIVDFFVTKGVIFQLKCTIKRLAVGLRPKPAGRAHSAPQTP